MTRVLVADDHPIFLRGLVGVLEDAGFQVVAEANNGAEAMGLLRSALPDLAVVDVGMPVMNGIGVLRRAQKEGLACTFVMLSLHDERSIAEAAFHLGARAYVLKDNACHELVAAARAALEGRTWLSASLGNAPSAALGSAFRQTSLQQRTEPAELGALTRAELRVLFHLADNLTSPQIAEQLGLSVRTVQNHRAHVCEKLGLTGTHRLLQLALTNKNRIRALLGASDAAEEH